MFDRRFSRRKKVHRRFSMLDRGFSITPQKKPLFWTFFFTFFSRALKFPYQNFYFFFIENPLSNGKKMAIFIEIPLLIFFYWNSPITWNSPISYWKSPIKREKNFWFFWKKLSILIIFWLKKGVFIEIPLSNVDRRFSRAQFFDFWAKFGDFWKNGKKRVTPNIRIHLCKNHWNSPIKKHPNSLVVLKFFPKNGLPWNSPIKIYWNSPTDFFIEIPLSKVKKTTLFYWNSAIKK